MRKNMVARKSSTCSRRSPLWLEVREVQGSVVSSEGKRGAQGMSLQVVGALKVAGKGDPMIRVKHQKEQSGAAGWSGWRKWERQLWDDCVFSSFPFPLLPLQQRLPWLLILVILVQKLYELAIDWVKVWVGINGKKWLKNHLHFEADIRES